MPSAMGPRSAIQGLPRTQDSEGLGSKQAEERYVSHLKDTRGERSWMLKAGSCGCHGGSSAVPQRPAFQV
jgi:hypothetical protein